jgi:type IV pilus assembly protein PilM
MTLRGTGVGIDIGASAIKVVELRVSEKGAVVRRALFLDREALRARGVDPADRPKVAALLRREMDAAGIARRDVVLGISGKDCILHYVHVPPVPTWRLKIIMDYEVGERAEKIGEPLTGDYRVLPVTRDADDDQSVILGLSKEATLTGFLVDLTAAGITVAKAVPAPLALYGAYASFGKKPDLESPDDELVAVVDLGAENLNMAFLLNGNLAFARSASFGGKNFTEAIARDQGMDLERAEAAKLRSGTVDPAAGRGDDSVNSLRGAAAQLLSMIQSSLKFSRSQTGVRLPEPTRYVLLGGGAALHGLVSYLQAGLGRPVEVFHPEAASAGDIGGDAAQVLGSAPGNFAVALGLAAAALRREGMELTLLPGPYLERRTFRERTIFLYAAAGLLAAFLVLRLVQGFSENSSARAREADLKSWQGFFGRAKAQMLEDAARNGRAKARLNRMLREAEVTPFQAFVLDLLAKRAGSEMKVNGMKLLTEFDDEGNPIYQFQVDGAADNASLQAVKRIEALEEAFSSDARVAKVEVLSTVPDGNWYRFQMMLTPNFTAYR